MSTFFTNVFKFFAFSTISIMTLLGLVGCAPPEPGQPTTSVNNEAGNVNANANVSQPPVAAEPSGRVAVTLPLLDAVLADEELLKEAKVAVQLTDAEIQKLRDTARNAVLQLSDETTEDDDARSTRAAASNARKQLEEVLGADRAGKFIAFIDKRLAGSGELAAAKPNQVPTDTRVVVNAPAYRMDIFENGKLIQSYKVGIGYPEFPLPTGLREAKSIIFNPTWTPPDEPWVKGKLEPGKKVEAGSKLNPLGPIKIPIGLPSLIHGGKSPARLGTFASHGCVGLTNGQIQDFAMRISGLSGEPVTMGDIKGYEKSKTETKEVNLKQPLPVELRYETIVVEDGVLKIYRDVYEKGTNTEENLRRVLDTFGVSFDSLQPQVKEDILKGLDRMAVDAMGKHVDGGTGANANSNSNSKTKESESGKVTRNIKGAKMLEFKVPELAGKGYPAAVGTKM